MKPMKPATFLLRDDDVYDMGGRFMSVFELCLKERMPVTYAVIPSKLKKSLVGFLRKHKTQQEPFDIVQHGWAHANHNTTGRWPRYEFGPRRRYAVQKEDMARGLERMRAAFGPLFTPAFVPPFHYYDANTLRAAQTLKYLAFSAGPQKFVLAKQKPLYMHAQLSINEYDAGYRSMPLSLPRLMHETARLISQERLVGAYFHHSTLDPRNFDIFKVYLRFLKRLVDGGWIKPMTFSAYNDALEQEGDRG